MAKPSRRFLNIAVSEELIQLLDDAAEKSGWDRSKQARYMLERAFGVDSAPKPYYPDPANERQLGFGKPPKDTQARKPRNRQRATLVGV